MRTKELRQTEQVWVYKAGTLAGSLSRTVHGAKFQYDSKFRSRSLNAGHYGLCFTMPPATEAHEIVGTNVHPFFAGLLPEGLRLKALYNSLKTSADDLFTLLVASGSNLIGDVYVRESQNQDFREEIEIQEPSKVSFSELFQQSIESSNFALRDIDSSIPGVMPKVSASMVSFPIRIHKRNRQYLLKLGSIDYPRLIENEHFFMHMGRACGINTAHTTIVYDKNRTPGLLIERFDRIYDVAVNSFIRRHQEDACQFLNRFPQDKYRLSMREIADGIQLWSSTPIIDCLKLIELYIFSYIIGNGDLHAKNISLLEQAPGQQITFSPIYDLLSTIPYGDRQMALKLGAKNDNFRLKHFIEFGKLFEVNEKAIRSTVFKMARKIQVWLPRLEDIGLTKKKHLDLRNTCESRVKDLSKDL